MKDSKMTWAAIIIGFTLLGINLLLGTYREAIVSGMYAIMAIALLIEERSTAVLKARIAVQEELIAALEQVNQQLAIRRHLS